MEFIDIPLPVNTEKPPDMSLSSEIQYIPSGERLDPLLHSTAEYLKNMTNSDGYIIYSLDDTAGELYICTNNATEEDCITNRYRWNIQRGETIAIYAFKNMTPIIVDANNSVDLNFPYLQALPSLYPRYILSLPLVNFQKRCFGVVEYYRNNGKQYNEADVKLCHFLLLNCAEAFKQNENAVFFTKLNENQLKLQELLEMYAFQDEHKGSYLFLNQIVEMARTSTRAMSAAFFFKKQGDLVRIVNTDERYSVGQNEDVKNDLGPIMRSIVTAKFNSTLMNRNIHGIIKVYNKIGRLHFTILDEQCLEAFAQMCTLWSIIEYMCGYLRKQKTLNENILALINLQLQNAADFDKKLKKLLPPDLKELNSWNYSLKPPVERIKLLSDLMTMIKLTKGGLPILDEAIKVFIVMVSLCYRNEEEIEYRHTVLSVQSLFLLLKGCSEFATEIEGFAMIIASLCHNITINSATAVESSIFGRYNLYAKELIRFEVVQFLIQETQMLNQLNIEDQNTILKMIKESIVAMNLNFFKLNIATFSKSIQENNAGHKPFETDIRLRPLIQSILPGLGNILGHFKSQPFYENFPHFFLFQYLEENNLSCFDIILAISSI